MKPKKLLLGLTVIGLFLASITVAGACGLPSALEKKFKVSRLGWGVTYYRGTYDKNKLNIILVDLQKAGIYTAVAKPQTIYSMLKAINKHRMSTNGPYAFAGINGGFFSIKNRANFSWVVQYGGDVVEPESEYLYSDDQRYRVLARSMLMIREYREDGIRKEFVNVFSPLKKIAPFKGFWKNEKSDWYNDARKRISGFLKRTVTEHKGRGQRFMALQGADLLLPVEPPSSSTKLPKNKKWMNPDHTYPYQKSRTAVGLINNQCVILATLDKPGVNIERLRQMISKLGARKAISMDGGGSTQMIIKGDRGPDDFVTVSQNDNGRARNVPTGLAVLAYPMSVFVAAKQSLADIGSNRGFLDRTVSLYIPGNYSQVVLSADKDGLSPFGVDDFALVYVTGPSGRTQNIVLNANDGYGKPIGEQYILSNGARIEPGMNTIRIVLMNKFAPPGPNAGNSPIWVVIK